MNLNVSSSSQRNNVFSIFYVIFYCTFINVRYFVYFGWGSSIIYASALPVRPATRPHVCSCERVRGPLTDEPLSVHS